MRLRFLPTILRFLGLVFVIIALARPQSHSSSRQVWTEGVDIIIAIDVSTSMEARDFKPSRIEAAKETALDFITKRPNDRIGLVIFASESFTQCPTTLDHEVLKSMFSSIKAGMVQDGTAIGMGLSTAVSRLKDSKATSKVIILLTDGVNNTGFVAPLTAADIAKTFGIRVYSIGIGTRGMAPYPVQTPYGIQYQNMEVQIDEDILKKISTTTAGKYFRATDNSSLEHIYEEIDKLEKTKFEEAIRHHYKDEYLLPAIIAAALLLLDIFLSMTYFRAIP